MPEAHFNLTSTPEISACRKMHSSKSWSPDMRRLPTQQRNARVRRERDFRALSRLALLLVCGLILAVGFVFAARQQFAAVRYGYECENLRAERQRLWVENQRLLLEKEQASAPERLESAARQLGLKPIEPGQVGVKTNEQRHQPVTTALIRPSASFNR
jgi:cell division protein FtsL